MKIGEIKAEALKLMFANYAFDFSIADLPTMYGDENYGSYIVNMNGSISRALDRIQNACVVQSKTHQIVPSELVVGKHFSRFDTNIITDLYVIDRITAEDDKGNYYPHSDYQTEGNVLVLANWLTYAIIYYPTLKGIDDSVGDESEIWVHDHLARLIPYFIKSELYQEEEPNLAQEARNLFEMSLDDLKQAAQGNQTRIKRVIGMR